MGIAYHIHNIHTEVGAILILPVIIEAVHGMVDITAGVAGHTYIAAKGGLGR